MSQMRIIKLDASQWKTPLDFYDALLSALEAPEWHGWSINALIDSMVWGNINAVEPPYRIWVVATAKLPSEVKKELDDAILCINAAQGNEKDIEFLIEP
jgi:RNAse (barnase) inhibitor barstar